MPNEITMTDQFVRKNLDRLGLSYDEQGSSIKEVKEALKNGSKTGKGGVGKPEFVLQVKDFLIVIEDKLDNDKNIKRTDKNEISLDTRAKTDYATNGAVHYAKHIAENSGFKKIFAIGITGNEKHHIIQPVFVTDEEITLLNELETLENFTEENIEEYYKTEVLKETPTDQVELKEIIKLSKQLHEDLRNYGQLSEHEKPLVVSAILLALQDENFSIDLLIGNQVSKDGKKIFDALSNYLDVVEVTPDFKKQTILDQFSFIKSRVKLNEIDSNLGKTPSIYFDYLLNAPVFLELLKHHVYECIGGRSVHLECGIF